MHSGDITLENISKIEGHANLSVKIRNKKVEHVKLQISESKRYFQDIVVGKSFMVVPSILARICGTCSVAHLLTAIEAVERAAHFEASEQTIRMRKLLQNAMQIRDHTLHLYFFSLPDYLGVESALDFKGKLHKHLHNALDLKKAGNDLCTLIGGGSVHPAFVSVGGFLRFPDDKKVKELIKYLKQIRPVAIETINLFASYKETFERPTCFVGMVNEDYNFLEGEIRDTCGMCIPEITYGSHFRKFGISYSTADGFKHNDREYMVGALARINLNMKNLHKKTRKDSKNALKLFPSISPFRNNLAQAIEILHCIDYSIDLLKVGFVNEKVPKLKIEEKIGYGVTEAPRGTLYHEMHFDKNGKVKKTVVVIPTAQNVFNIEQDIKKLVPTILHKKKKDIGLELEKLIRAYDPCMSCATHFLKVKWI